MTPQCKTQADCFEELARVMRMTKDTGISWFDCIKGDGVVCGAWMRTNMPSFTYPERWSFAIAIVEDKPVFVGDILWLDGERVHITGTNTDSAGTFYLETFSGRLLYPTFVQMLSWNPPALKKPETKEEKCRELQAIQKTSCDCYNYHYFRGMYNGMEVLMACLEDREANYIPSNIEI